MGKSPETTKSSVWPLFLTAHAVLVEQIDARLADEQLPPLGWYDVLWGLERTPERRLRMSELADKVVLSRSNLTRLVDRLEEEGLVTRARSAEDSRGAYAVLTDKGQEMRRMWPPYQAAIRELFDSRLSGPEAELMAAVLRRLLDAARGIAPERGPKVNATKRRPPTADRS